MGRLLEGVTVEWKPLRKVAEYSRTRISSNILDESNYVGVDNLLQNRSGKTQSNYVPTEGNLTGYGVGDILIGNIRPYLKKIWHADCIGGTNGDVLVIHITDKKVDSRYLYQVLADDKFFDYNMQHAKGAKMPRGNKDKILEYQIPIPPLEIQAKIVCILDTFAELTAELTARKKQYAYYRNQLLTFEDGQAEWKPLGQIGEFIRGKRFTKADYVEDGISVIHYGEIYTQYGVWTAHTVSKVRFDMADSLRYAQPNDVVMAGVGETVEDVGKAVAWIGTEKVAIHDDSYAFRHSMNPKYISYAMQTSAFIDEKAKHVSRGKVNRLLVSGIEKIRIPVPPLETQARIVAILDKFDALTNSITEGLPLEIAQRQQQYEYYRELLLSFPKLVVGV